jgi:DNA-binding response OmpR family regulator
MVNPDLPADIACGLDVGADDYITKPFSVRELLRGYTLCFVAAGPAHLRPPLTAPKN